MLLLAALLIPAAAHAADDDEIDMAVRDELQKYDFSEWEANLNDDDPLFGQRSISELIDSYINGEGTQDPENLLEGTLNSLSDILGENVWWMLCMLAISAISGVADALMPKEGDVRNVAGFVILIMSAGVITAVFSKNCARAAQTIQSIAEFSKVTAPVLAVMLTATGASATAGTVSPLMAFLSNGVIGIMRSVVMPAILFGGALCVISSISPKVRLDRMQGLIKSSTKWSLGLLSTVYLGTLSIRGLVAASHDGVGIKTAKYFIDKGMPVAGGIVSGTFDTVFYSASLIKGAAGAAAVVAALSIVVMPLLHMLGNILTLRLTAALSEPIGGEMTAKMLSSLADWTSYLFAITAAVGAMFMITVGLIAHLYGG